MIYHGIFNSGFVAYTYAKSAVDKTKDAMTELKSENKYLRVNIEKLLMITEALWSILKEQYGYTDDELLRRIQEIDMQDGVMDGKVTRPEIKTCQKCNRPLMKKLPQCIYCGTVNWDIFGI